MFRPLFSWNLPRCYSLFLYWHLLKLTINICVIQLEIINIICHRYYFLFLVLYFLFFHKQFLKWSEKFRICHFRILTPFAQRIFKWVLAQTYVSWGNNGHFKSTLTCWYCLWFQFFIVKNKINFFCWILRIWWLNFNIYYFRHTHFKMGLFHTLRFFQVWHF